MLERNHHSLPVGTTHKLHTLCTRFMRQCSLRGEYFSSGLRCDLLQAWCHTLKRIRKICSTVGVSTFSITRLG
jgi:hypothetical protein